MGRRRFGTLLAGVGAVYLLAVSWGLSWWYVPAIRASLGPPAVGHAPGGTVLSVAWALSGVVGAGLLGFGVAVHAGVERLRLLLASAACAALLLWLALWSGPGGRPAVFGVGGGIVLCCFVLGCVEWSRARQRTSASTRTAADLRLAAHVCFFIAAWGLCGLLGAPLYALRPELASPLAASNLAVKVLVFLVLGWVLTASAQRSERRNA